MVLRSKSTHLCSTQMLCTVLSIYLEKKAAYCSQIEGSKKEYNIHMSHCEGDTKAKAQLLPRELFIPVVEKETPKK